MDTAYELMSAHPFLAGLTPSQLDRLSVWSSARSFGTGVRLFEEGGRADRFWLLHDGTVTLDVHGPTGNLLVETLGPGTVLGWSWMNPPYRWRFGAAVTQAALALEFDGPAVRDICDTDPALGYELTKRFMAVVVDRLQATRVRLLDLYRTAS
jgi:CRP/FNR family transcriptional regulator, cyclic AMP receptor protein